MFIYNLLNAFFNVDGSNEAELLGIGMAQWITSLINMNNDFTVSIFNNSMVNSLLWFISGIADLFFITGIAFAFFEFGINKHEGKDFSVKSLILNIFTGLIATICLTTLPVLLLKFTNYICNLICRAFTNNAMIEFVYNSAAGESGNAFSGWGTSILYIVVFVCVMKVFLANLKRGGILITLMFIGSIHVFSVPRGYLDAFSSWCKQVIGVCITSFMSNVLIVLGAVVYSTNSGADIGDLILSAGVMLAAAEVPRIAQQFGLDTSMKTNVSQAIYAASGITSIVRSFTH